LVGGGSNRWGISDGGHSSGYGGCREDSQNITGANS